MALTGRNLPFNSFALLINCCIFKAHTGRILSLLSTKKSCGPHMCQLHILRTDIGTWRTLRSVMPRRVYLIVKFVYTNPVILYYRKYDIL